MNPLIELAEKSIHTQDGSATFFAQESFPWARQVEAFFPLIRKELDAVLSAIHMLPGFEDIQKEQRDLTSDRRWKIFPLYAYGRWAGRNQSRCPNTAHALSLIPGLKVAMFSIFEPGKELAPHRGPYCGVLRYHLGLKVPQPETQCGIRVGADTAHWREGASMIFDDSHEHQAWNHSKEARVVLFADFVRPLPPSLQKMNLGIIDAFGKSTFMEDAARNWNHWEAAHGDQFDRILAAQ